MRALSKYIVLLAAVYVAAWTVSYAAVLASRGDGLDFTWYFEYWGLAWTFRGGELPSFIWLCSIIVFVPLAVFVLRRSRDRLSSRNVRNQTRNQGGQPRKTHLC